MKHISGWYHPAMRLQAELHSQEGINAELREQLRLARLESQSARSVSEKSADSNLSSIMTANDLATINNIHQTLQDLFTVCFKLMIFYSSMFSIFRKWKWNQPEMKN